MTEQYKKAALTAMGAVFGRDLYRVVFHPIKKEGNVLEEPTKVYSVKSIKITAMEITEYEGTPMVMFNNDPKFVLPIGSIPKQGEGSGKIDVAKALQNLTKTQWYWDAEAAIQTAKTLNQSTIINHTTCIKQLGEDAESLKNANKALDGLWEDINS